MGNRITTVLSYRKNNIPSTVISSLLDEIISRPDTDEDHEIYRFANYRKGGFLIEAFNRGGIREVEVIARKELKKYMYGNGEGALVPEINYLQVRHRRNNEVAITVETLMYSASILTNVKPEDRRVCWKLDLRGMLGESLLHVLILCNTPLHTSIARALLNMYPHLAWDIIEGEEYYGTTALHLSIAYHKKDLVLQSLEGGALINQRASGRFFMPYDQQRPAPKSHSDFEGLSYMGEYPLAWAACCEDKTIYDLLLHHGANPNFQDKFGNSVLHVLVIRDKLKMYRYALRHPTKPAKDNILNKSGLTPLTLACKLGRSKIFLEMLELSAVEFWRYSRITCSGYPLSALDSILPSGETNRNSALIIILNGTKNEHLDMLDSRAIQRLLEEKWKTFARNRFLKRLALMFLHLITLSIAVSLRPTLDDSLLGPTDVCAIFRYCAELGTCLGCVTFLVFQQGEEVFSQGILGFLINLVSTPTKIIFLFANISILLCVPCRLMGDRQTEDTLLSFAIPGCWLFLIFFAGAVKLTGPFVTMIYNMLVGDIVRFSIIYFIFLLGFTQAFYFLFKNHAGKTSRFQTFSGTWMALFHMTLGFFESRSFSQTIYYVLTWFVFAVFVVMMPILMINILIAMMGNTYCDVITQSEREFVKQWAKIVVALEKSVSPKQAKAYMQSYSIKLATPSSGDDPKDEQRAVMVIKSKLKSKVKERKDASLNWKRLVRSVIQELRQCDCTPSGFELPRISVSALPKSIGLVNDSFDNEDNATLNDEKTLEVVLEQLAFVHDLDLNKKFKTNCLKSTENTRNMTSTNGSSLGNLLQQLSRSQELEVGHLATPGRSREVSASKESFVSFPSSETCSRYPSSYGSTTEYYQCLQRSNERNIDNTKNGANTSCHEYTNNKTPNFGHSQTPHQAKNQVLCVNMQLHKNKSTPRFVTQAKSVLGNPSAHLNVETHRRRKKGRFKTFFHRGRVGTESKTDNRICSSKLTCHKRVRSANNLSCDKVSRDTVSRRVKSSLDLRNTSRFRYPNSSLELTTGTNQHHSERPHPLHGLCHWSTKTIVPMTSLLAWNEPMKNSEL
ncbi:uncharacterized protein LOC143222084 [Tachypleus tridentatus]|uniref:uncharacterized protein LOC143222084 n=1 Tax=Tachypleus tridentatus TaxID=6853 RepID=UPI003FD2323B